MKNPYSWRFMSVEIILSLVGIGIIVQIIRLQTSPHASDIVNAGIDGQWVTYYPPRGEIYDRHGYLLAGNETVYEFGVDLANMRDLNSLALAASVYLGLDFNTVLNQLEHPKADARYIVLDSFVPVDKADNLIRIQNANQGVIRDQNLIGLNYTPFLKRSYPESTLASNILGFFSREGVGYYGLEEKYNDLLSGMPITMWVSVDPNRVEELPEIPPGATFILTIDRGIQSVTEEILDSAIQTFGAESGTIIVSDPQTGEIYAIATTPRLDLNQYWTYNDIFPEQMPFDSAISRTYEPGSVMKILTMAAALDASVVTPETEFIDPGSINIGGATITNWDGKAYGQQDMTGCLQHSLNVCLAWVATQLGNDRFYNYMQRFGLGHSTGIDLAGEVIGRLKLPGDGDWYEADLGTNAFGQGVSVTPIQMVMAASAIANKGEMVYPHVLRAIVQNGQQHNMSSQIVGYPISTDTANTLNEMLATSLESEASRALVKGYRLAGKTGTAQIATQYGYVSSQTNVSFVGWGPVDDPQFFIYIWIEKPSASIWGSEVAAPIFRQVAEKVIVILGIPPTQDSQILAER